MERKSINLNNPWTWRIIHLRNKSRPKTYCSHFNEEDSEPTILTQLSCHLIPFQSVNPYPDTLRLSFPLLTLTLA